MTKKMLIDAAHPEEVRVCVLDNGAVEDFDFESATRKPLRGNIYLARVTRVEPSLQAAFIEFGGNRHGFLAFNEIHPDYYQVPVSDRRLLQEAEAEEAMLAAELEGDEHGDDAAGDAGDDEAGDDEAEEADGADGPGSEDNTPPENPDPSLYDDSEDRFAGFSDDDADEAGEAEAPEGTAAPDDGDESGREETATADAEGDAPQSAGDGEIAGPDDEAGAEAGAGGEASAPHAATTDRGRRRAELLERYREARRKRARLLRNYKIQEVIKRRQILLVQVVKEERGNKGAALTTYLSLAGRYCVLMPNTARGGGISRKIPVAADRKRLRRVVDSLDVPSGMGLIVRTAGAKRTKAEIKRDYEYLIRLWENIRNLTLQSIAPCLIYEEASLIKRAIRDLYDKDIDQVLVEGDAGYREAKDFMKMLVPSHAKSVQPYKDKTPLFLKYDVESQLDAMYQPVVRLKSGGYIVIHQTEALVAIDVNSGKATRERNIELTALKTNLEAAKEAARQFRMRDLAGLIVIDFIDMEETKNNRLVEKRLKDALKFDRARLQVGRISNFGLLEMSRQRRRSGIVDGTTHACPTCNGAGVVRSSETAALRILRAIEREALSGRAAVIAAKASLEVTLYILNNKREWLKRIEDDYALRIEIVADASKAGDIFEIEKRGAARDLPAAAPYIRADQGETIELPGPEAEEAEEDAAAEAGEEAEAEGDRGARDEAEGGRRRRSRRGRRGRRGEGAAPHGAERPHRQPALTTDHDDDGDAGLAAGDDRAAAREADDRHGAAAGDGQRKRRRRGRRGGRRSRGRDGESPPVENGSGANVAADHPPHGAENAAAPAPSGHAPDLGGGSEPEPAPEFSSRLAPPGPMAPEAPAASDAGSRAPAAAPPEAEPADTAPRADRPARKGWWQRAIGG